MPVENDISREGTSPLHFVVGSVLMVHFVVVCALKTSQGYQADIFWMSHVALALAGAGFLLNSRSLIGAALTSIAVSHTLWLYDFAAARFTQSHPLLITQYLDIANTATWIATLHHFYLLPLLLLTIRKFGTYRFDSLAVAAALVIATTITSRVLLPESRNVNWAFAIMPGSRLGAVHWANALPAIPYLALVIAWQILVMLVPAAVLLRLGTQRSADRLSTKQVNRSNASSAKPRMKRAA